MALDSLAFLFGSLQTRPGKNKALFYWLIQWLEDWECHMCPCAPFAVSCGYVIFDKSNRDFSRTSLCNGQIVKPVFSTGLNPSLQMRILARKSRDTHDNCCYWSKYKLRHSWNLNAIWLVRLIALCSAPYKVFLDIGAWNRMCMCCPCRNCGILTLFFKSTFVDVLNG